MFPRFKHGEAIWVDWAVDQLSLRDGWPYVVCIPHQGCTIKNVFFSCDKMILKPVNPEYPTLEIRNKELDESGIKLGAVMLRVESFE